MTKTSLKQRIATCSLMFALAGASLAGAALHRVQAEPAKSQADDAGVWVIITHKVYDYKRWSNVHVRSAELKRNYGWRSSSVFAVDGDPNHVMVMEHFSALDRARAFADSSALRDEMAASGVSSNPEIRFVRSLQDQPVATP